jgi:hypothetical protein
VKILFLIIVNVLGHPKGVGGLTSNFLCGGGMDVFWNDPISGNSLMPKLSSIQIKSRACNFCSDFLLLMDVNEWMSYKCSDESTHTQNINNSSTLSHASEEENHT